MFEFTTGRRGLVMLSVLGLAIASPAQSKGNDAASLGVQAIKAGKLQQGIRHLQAARHAARNKPSLRQQIDHLLSTAHARLGHQHYQAKRLDQADQNYQAANRYQPGQEAVLQSLAVIRFRQDRRTEAQELLQQVLAQWPNNVAALQLMGRLAADRDDVQVANRYLSRAASLQPKHKALARAAGKMRKEAVVEKDFKQKVCGSFLLQYPPGRPAGVERNLQGLQGVLEQARAELRKRLSYRLSRRITVVFYTPEQYRKVNSAHAWAQAYYDGKLRVAYNARRGIADPELRRSLRHELTHAFLTECYGKRIPMWVHEGYAQVLEGKSVSAVTERFRAGLQMLPQALFLGDFASSPQISVVRRGYEQSLFAVGYLLRKGTRRQFRSLLLCFQRGMTTDAALRQVYRMDSQQMLGAAKK